MSPMFVFRNSFGYVLQYSSKSLAMFYVLGQFFVERPDDRVSSILSEKKEILY